MVAEGAAWRRCLGRAERRFFGLPSSGRISFRLPRGAHSAGDKLVDGLTLIRVARALEQIAPRGDVRAPAEQRTPLPLGHPARDAELDSVVERIRKALRANRASPADQLGAILRCSLDEQLVRVGSLACGACGPVSDPHVPTPLDRRARTHDGRLDGVAIPGQCVRPPCHGYLFVTQQLTEVRARCQDPGMAIYQIVLTDYIQDPKIVTLRIRSCSHCKVLVRNAARR